MPLDLAAEMVGLEDGLWIQWKVAEETDGNNKGA